MMYDTANEVDKKEEKRYNRREEERKRTRMSLCPTSLFYI